MRDRMQNDVIFKYNTLTLGKLIKKDFKSERFLEESKELLKSVYRRYGLLKVSKKKVKKDISLWFEKKFDCRLRGEISRYYISSKDRSVKFLIKLKEDASYIESVLIPEKNRVTLCLSTQVGCRQACSFCHTGRMGLKRNLDASEIVSQYLLAFNFLNKNKEELSFSKFAIRNIVFMGMGEPLDNIKELNKAISILSDKNGINLSEKRMTVSTVGVLPNLREFLETSYANVAISVHSPFEDERSKIVIANRKWPLKDILETLRHSVKIKERTFFIQYTLINGVNDSLDHAHKLADILKNIPSKINLIPLNEHDATSFKKPKIDRVHEFRQVLMKAGFVTTIRFSKGEDIFAACGQLIK